MYMKNVLRHLTLKCNTLCDKSTEELLVGGRPVCYTDGNQKTVTEKSVTVKIATAKIVMAKTVTARKDVEKMNIGTKITTARRQCGMTQSELADRMCVTRQTVSRWEAGSAMPDIEKVSQIAKLLQVSCDYLLNDECQEGEENDVSKVLTEGSGITELLRSLVGRRVKISFYDDEEDYEVCGETCQVMGFEGNWMKIQILKKKETREKMIALSSVLSFELLEEEA